MDITILFFILIFYFFIILGKVRGNWNMESVCQLGFGCLPSFLINVYNYFKVNEKK